jgi:hypothetical protein
MAIEYTDFLIPRPSKIYPNLDFWSENIAPYGNPAEILNVFLFLSTIPRRDYFVHFPHRHKHWQNSDQIFGETFAKKNFFAPNFCSSENYEENNSVEAERETSLKFDDFKNLI